MKSSVVFFRESLQKSQQFEVNKTEMLQFYIIIFHLVHLSLSIEDQWRIKIPCQANIEQGLKYRKITWYKVDEISNVLTGLVLKNLIKNITLHFKFAKQSYEVGEDNSLLIPGAAGENCGLYRCTLWPPLGQYIQEGDYEYYSADCMKPQQQAVSSRKDPLPDKNNLKIFTLPCILMACAVVVMFLNYRMIKQAKEKANIQEKLVQTDENL
ncbi:uncharacterized protein LOC127414937 isoform X1 [Myxocyprinus asiaticus]|uniref:uncharacterized protein LOC127414937 isoform X1 n=1 Tax=Myxocyprinus asiaticus TaxID=70543 RepID=UPI002223742E|nr:uncharacterized protein LOC127414937 isoform X1 [Myxocyprinus asiaticus]